MAAEPFGFADCCLYWPILHRACLSFSFGFFHGRWVLLFDSRSSSFMYLKFEIDCKCSPKLRMILIADCTISTAIIRITGRIRLQRSRGLCTSIHMVTESYMSWSTNEIIDHQVSSDSTATHVGSQFTVTS